MGEVDPNPNHREDVRAWFAERVGVEPSAERSTELLLVGLQAVWSRSRTSLGDVTLAAIYGRVIDTARRDKPILASLDLAVEEGRLVLDVGRAAALDPHATREAAEHVLTDLLEVLGRLTGEALSAALHRELWRTAAPSRVTDDVPSHETSRGRP